MGKVTVLLVLSLPLVIYPLSRIANSSKENYSWAEMDWNQDGKTSMKEIFAAIDIGKRETTLDGKKCIEYFSYKDGLSVKIVCQD